MLPEEKRKKMIKKKKKKKESCQYSSKVKDWISVNCSSAGKGHGCVSSSHQCSKKRVKDWMAKTF